jgi:hypothetical protein
VYLGVCGVGWRWCVRGVPVLAASIELLALAGAERVWKCCGLDCGIGWCPGSSAARHYCRGFTAAPAEPRLVRHGARLRDLDVPLLHAVEPAVCITTPLPRWHVPVCAVVRWLSMLGMEPTAKQRGLDSHRTTVEHNLRARRRNCFIQIDHPRFEARG